MSDESWIVNDGCCMILVCDLTEMVGIKVAWHWYEMRFHIQGFGKNELV